MNIEWKYNVIEDVWASRAGGIVLQDGSWFGRSVYRVAGPPLGPFASKEEAIRQVEKDFELLKAPLQRVIQGQPLFALFK